MRVLVVDDHQLLGQMLAHALDGPALCAGSVSGPTIDDVMAEVRSFQPEVVLLDLDLGDMGDGRKLIQRILETGSEVIVLTACTDPRELGRALEEGAVGLLHKDCRVETVRRAIDKVLCEDFDELLPPSTRDDLLRSARSDREARAKALQPFDQLSRREAAVLRDLMSGYSAAQIAERSFVAVSTVRSQIRAILIKLGVTSQLAAVARAQAAGWE